MKKAEAASIEQTVRAAFSDGDVERVEALSYGDDPEVGPGETAIRVFLNLPDAGPGRPARESLTAFRDANRGALNTIRHELRSGASWIEFRPGGGPASGSGSFRMGLKDEPETPELTPVMTRLGAGDLATVDTLIAAGIATSRAEVLRWAVGRIRENPAYDQLHERIQQIEELKARF
jgi:hypothetical protein